MRINNLFPSFSSFNSENYKLSIMEIKKLALATVTTIYTEKQFAKFILENPDKDSSPYIQVVDNLKRGEKCAFEINGILPPRSIAVLPNEKEVEIGYVLFLLNSYSTQYDLFDHKMNVLNHVLLNKKKLSSLTIPVIEKKEQRYYNIARIFKDNAEKLLKDPSKDIHMAELSYGLFANLCDSLAIELYFDDYLYENGVEIFKYWKENVDKYLDTDNTDKFFRSLFDQSSELRNQLMKLRMIPADQVKD